MFAQKQLAPPPNLGPPSDTSNALPCNELILTPLPRF